MRGYHKNTIEEVLAMPLVKISLRTGRSPDYKRALLDGVHAALVEAFLIPDSDRHQQLFELDEDIFEIPSTRSEAFVLVEIIAFQGRSLQAKRKLYAAIVRNFATSPGISGDDVMIILHEPPKENWGIRGGKPASEVDIGFKVDV
jgi:phenylpyruvate tautomerase PptA (4-oxalocrotonate tautomerase family)